MIIIYNNLYKIYLNSATVTNLQTKVESLTTTNALMKEDLAIAKNNLLSLYEENRKLKLELGHDVSSERVDEGGGGDHIHALEHHKQMLANSEDASALRLQLEEECKLRMETEKELDLQVNNFLSFSSTTISCKIL